MTIDTRMTVEIPEGADLPLHPAGIGSRIVAFLIDFLIKAGLMIAAMMVFAFMGRAGYGFYLIFFFLLEWFYPVVFEVWRNGQTPGKKYQSIAVVNDDGTPVTFAGSLIRNLLRFVDFLPLFYVAGIIASVCSTNFKRIGDMAAGTIVIYSHQTAEMPELDVQDKQAIPADFTTDEQRALLSFAERSKQLSRERQAELATILRPVLGDGDLVKTIKKMANTAMGHR